MIICKIRDLKPGNRFIYEDTDYILVDLNPATCFVGSADQHIYCALNMKNYKVLCFMGDTTVLY